MKLRSLALFGAGYVLGTKAGRERYAQIVDAAKKTAQRFDDLRRQRAKPSQRAADIDSYLAESRQQ
jgi:alpha-D-ribose 1-methylphosphonate 5-triphosphate synthase subunit PhnG